MAEETDPIITDDNDDWTMDDIDALLSSNEPDIEAAEKQADKDTIKLAKSMKKLGERQAKMEERGRVEKLTSEFYASASDEEKELADVLLAGVSDEAKTKKMLDLAKAKAKAMGASEQEAEETTEEEATSEAFAAPTASSHQSPNDPEADAERFRRERQNAGDSRAALAGFLKDSPVFGYMYGDYVKQRN